jgi:hypothetical protein
VDERFQFDELAKQMARALSRRDAFRCVGTGLMGMFLGSLGLERASGAANSDCSTLCKTLPKAQQANCKRACTDCRGNALQICASTNSDQVACCASGASCCGGVCCSSFCVNGVCSPCPSGQFLCNGQCCPSTNNCCGGLSCCPLNQACCDGGVCCAAGQICSGGKCTSCADGRPFCGSVCCPTSQTCCNNTCVDFASDPNNCGSCGGKCDSPLTCCGGQCVDLFNRMDHCGACNVQCQAFCNGLIANVQDCVNGVCTTTFRQIDCASIGGNACINGGCYLL